MSHAIQAMGVGSRIDAWPGARGGHRRGSSIRLESITPASTRPPCRPRPEEERVGWRGQPVLLTRLTMFSLGVAGLMGIGVQELLLITVIVVVVFGAGKLPQIGQGLGQMITNFRKSVKG